MKPTRKQLLIAAIVFHIIVTGLILLTGRLGLAGSMFNRNGVSAIASDGQLYRNASVYSVQVLKSQGVSAWLDVPVQVHVKIYSLLFLVLGWCFGYTILTIEPLNALCYGAIVALVYLLGRETFDHRTGILAAAIVGLWPSLLLHTTQFLKDPLLIVATLGVVYLITLWLKEKFSLRMVLFVWVLAEVLVIALLRLRREMWVAALAAVFIGLMLLVVRQVKERKLFALNMVCALALLLSTLATPFVVGTYHTPPELMRPTKPLPPGNPNARPAPAFFTALKQETAGTGSAVDSDVEFLTLRDIVFYLPRAAVIGFLAPFPSMWFATGNYAGRAGRLLSGIEMLITYVFLVMAIYGIWAERRRLHTHLLWILSFVAITGLGLAMANIGTLYRMRYSFWILLVVLAAGGALRLADSFLGERKTRWLKTAD